MTEPKPRLGPAYFGTFVVVILGFLWYIGVFGGNVHEVAANRVYRSAQLTGSNLDTVLKDDHIQTVVNLRGGSTDDAWYRSELAECRRYGVAHVDTPMVAERLPTPEELKRVLDAFDHSRYPILFHCKAGADRSGFVGTLYLNVYRHVPLPDAEARQLTWRYGHFSCGMTHAMDDFYRLYTRTSDGLDLRQWIYQKYPAVYATTQHQGVIQ